MKKRIVPVLLLLIVGLMLPSCSALEAVQLYRSMMDEHGDIHDALEVCVDDTGEYLIYDGEIYRRDETPLYLTCFRGNNETDDVLVSWSSALYYFEYYANRAENPTYIYVPRYTWIYIRSDYDYMADTYTVENTEISFVLSDAMTSVPYELGVLSGNTATITVISQECAKLRLTFTVARKDGYWYAVREDDKSYWRLTDAFAEELSQQGLI